MDNEAKKSLDELREFTRNADSKPNQPPEPQRRTSNTLTWKEIALGVYVGGIALAATSMLFWLIFAGLFITSMHGK